MDPSLKPGDSLQHRCAHCKRSIQVGSPEFPCSNCRKLFYCSEAHRKSHASKHEKSGCFPAIIRSNSGCGRYWVASRHIDVDEVIYTEKAMVLAPNIPNIHLYPTCLGCCRGTNTKYKCSKCGWPVCNKNCEKLGNHSMNECKIFKNHEIEASCRPQYYFFIQFLRALLLKERDPKGFEELMQLEPHFQARSKVKDEVFMLKSFYRFLTEDCGMDYDLHVVDHIVGVNRVNSYSGDALIDGKKRFCTAVFPKLSLINHNCKPNTRTILHERQAGSLYMELRASTDIEEGEEISQQYISSTKGTFLRRETLYEDWFFHCCCERCSDSTEFNTYFSAIKCVNCAEGYLLPKNPLESDSPWECVLLPFKQLSPETGCGYSRTGENVKQLTMDIDARIKLSVKNPKALERKIAELSLCSLHPNHYLLIDIKFCVLDEIVRKLNYVKENGTCFGDVGDDDILKGVEYAKSILGVIRKICSARSYCVGIILYFLACCLIELKERKINSKFTDAQVENVVKEAWTILRVESAGSTYLEMVKCLEDRSLLLSLENLSLNGQV